MQRVIPFGEFDWNNYLVGRLTRIDAASDEEAARVSWEFDCLSRPQSEDASRDSEEAWRRGVEAVRVRSTVGKFLRVCGVLPEIGDWFLLYFAGRKFPEGLPCQRSPLLVGGFDAAYPNWIFYGEKILDDRGDEPPRHPVGAATSDHIDWGIRVAQASNFPTSLQADSAALVRILGKIGRAKKVTVRDVGQANFCCLKDAEDNIILYYDVGWPLAFNQKTAPSKLVVDFTRAPIVLSHWDWDHFHHALRPQGCHLKDSIWIVPIQKLGPGAARFANELSKRGKLLGWKSGVLTLNIGLIGPCTAPSDSSNNSGLAMSVSLVSGRTFLLVGDADYDFLPSALMQPVDGLAITHHGARFQSLWTSIPRPTQPYAKCIVSYGDGNSYGHPHEEALEKHVSAGWRQVVPTAAFKGMPRADREFQ